LLDIGASLEKLRGNADGNLLRMGLLIDREAAIDSAGVVAE